MTSPTITSKPVRWLVEFSGVTSREIFAGFRFRFGYSVGVDAVDVDEAIELAKAEAKRKGFEKQATGQVTTRRIYTFAITLRGLDKRKRETYFVKGKDEAAALRSLTYNDSAGRFAGFYSVKTPKKKVGKRLVPTGPDPRVIKVERLD